MNTANHLSQEDLALLALQLLPEEETRIALEHLRDCAECRKSLGELQGDLALYSSLAEEHNPPAAARDRFLQGVAAEKRELPEEKHGEALQRPANVLQMKPSRATRSFASWSGWAVAAALAVAAVLLFQQRRQLKTQLAAEQTRAASVQSSAAASQAAFAALTDPAALNVVLHQPSTPGKEGAALPEGHAAYLPDRGALVFVAGNLQPLKPYKVYELWLLPAEKDRTPIPAASFRPDAAGNATVVLPTGPKLLAINGFGVTVEEDRTPPRQPTLPILLMGTSRT